MSSNIRINRICKQCGETFVAKTFKTQFCSHTCNSRFYKQKKREEKLQKAKEEYSTDLKISKLKSTKRHFDLEELKAKSYLSIAETCALVGMSDSTIRKLIKEQQLKTIRLGKKHLILKSQLDDLMN
ncbi:helix-turn-helix domain-containing protein [Bergeyella zoohelcum]|uniref:Excisionase family DNA binding domain-containing protein n=1 Tax=Bergeyella zoohelcum ATCC 43767 TaxID=883096 RepID=K1LL71_9FLAO|nr:helix-turn-helix domain-containing protein [Bergeyella zoohelcum]EKB57520.1 excisionase family DNA binding domain-containing protein [Bergeyella zoohelcum ATCC 43767]SUV48810.1 DNA binding domain, excisionase family [Bergeyella zoohelcum]